MPPESASDNLALTFGAGKQQAVCAPPSRQHKAVVTLLEPEERPYLEILSEHRSLRLYYCCELHAADTEGACT
jgi:hypothetical protein